MAGDSRLRATGCLIQAVFPYIVLLWLGGTHGQNSRWKNITDFNKMIKSDSLWPKWLPSRNVTLVQSHLCSAATGHLFLMHQCLVPGTLLWNSIVNLSVIVHKNGHFETYQSDFQLNLSKIETYYSASNEKMQLKQLLKRNGVCYIDKRLKSCIRFGLQKLEFFFLSCFLNLQHLCVSYQRVKCAT